MLRTTVSTFAAVGLLGALSAGCSSDSTTPPTYVSGGNTGTSGSTSGGTGNTGGGMSPTAGTGGSGVTAGTGGSGVTAGTGGSGGSGGGGTGDITAVWATPGCGQVPAVPSGQSQSISTSGTKQNMDTNQNGVDDEGEIWVTGKVGDWSYERNYRVNLPDGYDNTKAYPLVFMGPGCGGSEADIYPLNFNGGANVNNTVIRVGLDPPPNDIQHAEALNSGCFDDKEGDDSVDWPFYEALWDFLAQSICFDQNRVFASGNSSGAWLSNELGCKYAGDPVHPIRGAMPNTGGLPTDPERVPTCSTAPMAGFWSHEEDDSVNPFSGNEVAIARALTVNGCTATSYDASAKAPYPIGGGRADDECELLTDCPNSDLYPLVVCLLPGAGHGSHNETVDPGQSTFITSLMAQ